MLMADISPLACLHLTSVGCQLHNVLLPKNWKCYYEDSVIVEPEKKTTSMILPDYKCSALDHEDHLCAFLFTVPFAKANTF